MTAPGEGEPDRKARSERVEPELAEQGQPAHRLQSGAAHPPRRRRLPAPDQSSSQDTSRSILPGIAEDALDSRLRTLADLWRRTYHGDWDFAVEHGMFCHADGGSALVFEVAPTRVFEFAKGRFAQTRYRFHRASPDT